ncbi:DUF4055 domain-containing protein [Comamonas sp. MYb69]|uniref:DUF4055 domain-containing protein n=1 Tax=Comamonas sp. MYb69 TaxID=1848650 RepID=UPI00309AF76A
MTAINQQNDTVKRMAEAWAVIDPLMGGTQAMRKAGKTLLPQQPREDAEDYQYRLKTSTLFPAFGRTVGVMTGKPFAKELTLGEDVPQHIKDLSQDIDGEGRSLHAFSADLMNEAVAFGFGGILVDYTRTEGQARTQADEKALGARPYWVHVKHHQLLGWKTGLVNGKPGLLQLRILETAEVDDGPYEVKVVNRVRVLTPGHWEIWQEDTGGWALLEQGTTTIRRIPFVPIYGIRKGFMWGTPPLLDLAHLNVKHWQQQSDQDDSARFARKRLLVFTGVNDGELASPSAGSAYALRFENPEAKAEVIQGSAESVTVGRSELDSLESQMVQTGAELLTAKPGQRTATEAANDAEANKSDLQRIVESFEDSLDQALQFTAEWLGLPQGGHVSLFKDFAAGSLSEATAQLILSFQQGGLITKRQALIEAQRIGVVSPNLDPEAEIAAVEAEGPSLGNMNGYGE